MGHSYATAVLKAGINPKIVSHRLDHASVASTLSVHAHTFQASTGEAADEIAALVLGTAEGSVGNTVGKTVKTPPESISPGASAYAPALEVDGDRPLSALGAELALAASSGA